MELTRPAGFVAVVDVPAPPERAWAAVVDWPAHGRWVPLTTVRVLTGSAAGVGARFVGRTGIGPLAFDDPMQVVFWQPPQDGRPGVCEVVKQGRVVLGRARFEVSAAPGGSRIRWWEDVDVAPVALTRPLAPLLRRLGRAGVTRALTRMAHELAT